MIEEKRQREIKALLDKICNSEVFIRSSRYTQLLTFLVEQSLVGNLVKEQTIGVSMFNKNYNAIKDDGKVRVYMFNLRKKLKSYYEEEGSHDSIIFSLEKGKYTIDFTDRNNISDSHSREVDTEVVESSSSQEGVKRPFGIRMIALVTVALLCLISFLGYRSYSSEQVYCWESFLNKDVYNTVVLADQVLMYKESEDKGTHHTRLDVNNASDYLEFSKNNPSDSLLLANYTSFSKGIPFAAMELAQFFTTYKSNFNPKLESQLTYDVVKSGNVVYIGQPKTMSLSKEIFLKNSKIFRYEDYKFKSMIDGKKKVYYTKHGAGIRLEYAMVSFCSLGDDRKALYFASDNDIGVMATVDLFTNSEKLKKFYEELPSKDSYFNALFKVEGLNRLDVNCELVALEVIN